MYCLYREQYKSKRVNVPKYTHFPTTGYARVLLFMFIRRELAEERYRMFISVYILCITHEPHCICGSNAVCVFILTVSNHWYSKTVARFKSKKLPKITKFMLH